MAQSFYPITPVELTLGSPGSWQDVNVDAYVPSGTTGVIVHVENISTTVAYGIGLRKKGSTDLRAQPLQYNRHWWGAIGVDSSRTFQAYVASTTNINIYLVGYTMSGVTFFTNAYNVTPTSSTVWQIRDCSSQCPNAIGLIFEIRSDYADYFNYGLRKYGSSDDRIHRGSLHHQFGAIIGCDSNQRVELYSGNKAYLEFFLVGYITSDCIFNTNAQDISLNSTGTWLDLSSIPSANMAFIEVVNNEIASTRSYGLRKNGSSENIYRTIFRHCWGIIECDGNGIIEGKIDNTNVDFFLVGYAITSIPPILITPDPIQAIASVVAPSVVRGSISITPTPAQALCQVIAPTLFFSSTIATPSPVEAIAQVVQPNVRLGNIIFPPTEVSAIAAAVNPTVIRGSISLTPDFASAIAGIEQPIVVFGSTTVTPEFVATIAGVVAPIVSTAGVIYITPDPASSIADVIAPTVIQGSLVLTPGEVYAIAQVVAPTVKQSKIIFSPEYVKALAKAVNPTVIGGSLILSPAYIKAIARGQNPQVILASMAVTPEFARALAGVVAPTVLMFWQGRVLKVVVTTSQYRKVKVNTC